MKRRCLPAVLSLFVGLLLSCNRTVAPSDRGGGGGDTLKMEYAEMLTIVRYKGYTVVDIRNPWKTGQTLHTYVLVDDDNQSHLPKGTIVRIPVEHSIVFNAAHCQLLCYLDKADAINGVCDLKYIHIPEIQQRAHGGSENQSESEKTSPLNPITDCGDGMMPDVEKIVMLRPQALLLSPFENSGGYGSLENIGIPIIECADYMETTALGRAEWMKFYGLLYGCEDKAKGLFDEVKQKYNQLKASAAQMTSHRSILTERKTGSVWYCPGGRSTTGQVIADAHGSYAFADDRHAGSLPLSFEQVLDKAGDTDVWAFKYNGTKPMSRADLLAEFHGYEALKAFKTGEIYECNSSEKPFFEETAFRPDLLLREFMLLLHPEASDLGSLRYYEKIAE